MKIVLPFLLRECAQTHKKHIIIRTITFLLPGMEIEPKTPVLEPELLNEKQKL